MENLMPPLSETLRKESPAGYAPAGLPAPPLQPPATEVPFRGKNKNLRCPLPPLAASFDNLRQFNETGKTPHFRSVPLPVSLTVGGGSSVNITNVTSTGSGGSTSTNTATSIVAATTVINATIGPSSAILTTVKMALSFQLLSLTATAQCCVRIYGNATAQSLDSLRAIDAPVAAEIGQDIITDVVLDSTPYTWNWQDRIGASSSSPQSTTLYVTILNPLTLGESLAVAIKYIPLQTG